MAEGASMDFTVLLEMFFSLAPLVCLGTAAAGLHCAAETGSTVVVIKYLSTLALSFLWMVLGALVLFLPDLCPLPWAAAAYVLVGVLSAAPFGISLYELGRNAPRIARAAAMLGLITVLLFCAVSAAKLCSMGGSGEECLHSLCHFFLLPAGLVFLPAFALTVLELGDDRKRFGVNLLLLAIAPAGLFTLSFVSIPCATVSPCESGYPAPVRIALAVWLLCLFGPYGYMTLRGWLKKDEPELCNGIAGLWTFVFFLLAIGLLACVIEDV